MKFQITEIEFDFTNDSGEDLELSVQEELEITEETIGQIWDADNGDDLVEEITCATGWCIKSIHYTVVIPGILS